MDVKATMPQGFQGFQGFLGICRGFSLWIMRSLGITTCSVGVPLSSSLVVCLVGTDKETREGKAWDTRTSGGR